MRVFIRVISYLCLVVFCFLVILEVQNTDDLNVTSYIIESSKVLPDFDGYKILQLSDIHNHPLSYRNSRLLDAIDESSPNVIVCTGDFIDSHTQNLDDLETMFSHFEEKGYPVYFVSGNHEAYAPKALTEAFYALLGVHAVKMAEGKRYTLLPGLTLSGVRDPAWVSGDHGFLSRNEGDVRAQLDDLDAGLDDSMMNVMMAHRPELFDLYEAHGYDLAFTGHTHGNQMDFGFTPFSVNNFIPKYVAGLYREEASSLIVSRGLGYSYSLPWRFNCNAEIVVATLKNA